MKTTIQPVVQNSLECPECGKNTVVEVNSHLYRCINCDFYRELSVDPSKGNRTKRRSNSRRSDKEEGPPGFLAFIIIGLLMLLFI